MNKVCNYICFSNILRNKVILIEIIKVNENIFLNYYTKNIFGILKSIIFIKKDYNIQICYILFYPTINLK